MLALVLQIILEKHLANILLISASKNIIYFLGTILQNFSPLHKIGGDQPKNIYVRRVNTTISIRAARWFLFKPKIPAWAIFGGP
jgi:hypothetical protein